MLAPSIPGTVHRSTFYPVTGKLAAFGDGATTLTNTYKGSLLYSVGVEGPYGVRLTSGYGTGFRVTATHLFDGQSTTSLGLAYDNDDRVTSVGAERLAYDPASGILTGTAVGDGVSTITATILERSGFGEVKHVAATRSGAALYGADFEYDKLGRITSMTQALGGSATVRRFTYDLGGRLRAVCDGATTISTYSYDANGNRLSRADGQGIELATYDNRDRLLTYVFTYGTAVYGYDADGRLATRTVGAAQTVYGYDDLGNLKRVDLPDGRRVDYVLSPAGERIGRKVNGAWTHRFVYGAGLAPVAELDGNGRLKTRFVYAASASVPDYLVTYSGGTQTGLYRVLRDQAGSVRLVVNVATGTTAQRLDYDEFGRVLADSNPGFQPFGFAGGLWDADTGLVHFGAREYDPQTGRFTTLDPAGFSGGLNLYGYVMNDPVNLVDPAGLGPEIMTALNGVFNIFGTVGRVGSSWFNFLYNIATGNGADPNILINGSLNNQIAEAGGGDVARSICWAGQAVAAIGVAGAVAADYAATGCFMNLTCFVADTPIATEQGLKKIQDLQIGERVWAYSFTRQQLELSTVTQTFRNTVERLVDVTVAGQLITTTEEHPFWVVGQGWTPAKALRCGDRLCRLDGTAIQVQAVRIRSEHATVYNFEVADDHDYFVSSLGLLVHNTCGIYQFVSRTGQKYVGQSSNIARRISEHVTSKSLPAANMGTVIALEVQGGKLQREIMEQLLIEDLGGIVNLANKINSIGTARAFHRIGL